MVTRHPCAFVGIQCSGVQSGRLIFEAAQYRRGLCADPHSEAGQECRCYYEGKNLCLGDAPGYAHGALLSADDHRRRVPPGEVSQVWAGGSVSKKRLQSAGDPSQGTLFM